MRAFVADREDLIADAHQRQLEVVLGQLDTEGGLAEFGEGRHGDQAHA